MRPCHVHRHARAACTLGVDVCVIFIPRRTETSASAASATSSLERSPVPGSPPQLAALGHAADIRRVRRHDEANDEAIEPERLRQTREARQKAQTPGGACSFTHGSHGRPPCCAAGWSAKLACRSRRQ
eukprot:scaffold20728_cov132-Isochrysis_galbana.AAC.5